MRLQVCFQRNVHGRSRADVEAMAAAWDPVPPLFQQLDASALLSVGDKGAAQAGAAADGSAAPADAAAGSSSDDGGPPPPIPADDRPQPPGAAVPAVRGADATDGDAGGDDEDAVSPPVAKAGNRCSSIVTQKVSNKRLD